ncbi:MAG: bacteriophage Gp15 family protein [Novibacillus thermophilus]
MKRVLSLAYPIDDTVEINGEKYELDMSFDNVIRLIDMLNDDELDDITKIEIGLYMLLSVELDYDIEKKAKIFKEIFEKVILEGEKAEPALDIQGNPMPEKKEKVIYSLKEDAEYPEFDSY